MGTPRTPGTPKAGGTDGGGGGGEGRSASTRSARAQSMYAAVSEEEAPPPSTFEEEALASLHGLEAALGRLLVVLPRKALNQLRVSQGASATTNHAAASAGRMAPEPPRPSTAPLLRCPRRARPSGRPTSASASTTTAPSSAPRRPPPPPSPRRHSRRRRRRRRRGGGGQRRAKLQRPRGRRADLQPVFAMEGEPDGASNGVAPETHLSLTSYFPSTGEPDRPRQARRARLRARAEAPGRRRRRGVGERARARRRAAQGVDDARAEGAEGIQAVIVTIDS